MKVFYIEKWQYVYFTLKSGSMYSYCLNEKWQWLELPVQMAKKWHPVHWKVSLLLLNWVLNGDTRLVQLNCPVNVTIPSPAYFWYCVHCILSVNCQQQGYGGFYIHNKPVNFWEYAFWEQGPERLLRWSIYTYTYTYTYKQNC